jgi:hypothetical protein
MNETLKKWIEQIPKRCECCGKRTKELIGVGDIWICKKSLRRLIKLWKDHNKEVK